MRTVSILALALCLCGTAVRATLGGTANPQLQAAVESEWVAARNAPLGPAPADQPEGAP